jgi:membrane protein implicated in regulation of membrane protease activity
LIVFFFFDIILSIKTHSGFRGSQQNSLRRLKMQSVVEIAQGAFLVLGTGLLAVLIARNFYPKGILVQLGLLSLVLAAALVFGIEGWIGPPIGAIIAIGVILLIKRRAERRQQDGGGTEDGGVDDKG